MKIEIITPYATQLKDKIFKAALDDTLETWVVRQGFNDKFLTPVATQYYDDVILELIVNPITDNLEVIPSYWNNKTMPTDAVNAIVIGMFTAALLTHFSSDFIKLETTI